MSRYVLNKMIRDVIQNPDRRAAYFADATSFAEGYDLESSEREAFLARDIGHLYAIGVHGLILRPFTIILGVSEPDYLAAIRSV